MCIPSGTLYNGRLSVLNRKRISTFKKENSANMINDSRRSNSYAVSTPAKTHQAQEASLKKAGIPHR